MRRRIEALADQLEEFVGEDEHDVLLIRCASDAVGLVGAAIDLTEQRGSLDVNVPLFGAWEGEGTLRAGLRWIDELLSAAKLPPRSPVASADLAAELIGGCAHLAGVAASRGRIRVALWMSPPDPSLGDRYGAAALALLAAGRAHREVRLAFRDPDGSLALACRAAGWATREVALDASIESLLDGLSEDAVDPSLPEDGRAMAALARAATDATHGRPEAFATLAGLAGRFQERGQHALCALTFVLAGQSLAALGRRTEGRARLEQGLAIAVEHRAVEVIVPASLVLGDLDRADRALDAAEHSYRLALGVACGARQAVPATVAATRLGDVLLLRERPRDAHESWLQAVAIAHASGELALVREPLERLAAMYREAGLAEAHSASTDILAMLGPAHSCHGHAAR